MAFLASGIFRSCLIKIEVTSEEDEANEDDGALPIGRIASKGPEASAVMNIHYDNDASQS